MSFLVLYAKIVDDKDVGVMMTGIYIGGVAETQIEADEMARKCVSSTQGGTAIPRISRLQKGDLLESVKIMQKTFDRLADRMYDNERTIDRKELPDF